jgi:phosphoribosylanthranilate isomerase
MTWVKICGITNLEDAMTAVEAGADALGFVFYPPSPRYLEAEAARGLIAAIPRQVEKIGVFVDRLPPDLEAMAKRMGLTGLQLHLAAWRIRSQPARAPLANGFEHYIALRVEDLVQWEFAVPPAVSGRTILLDSGTVLQPGGTGRTFDWEKSRPFVRRIKSVCKVVIAGGLTAGNVRQAITVLEPWGVDVSSGVEMRPGRKDPDSVRAFVRAVRDTDRKTQ